MNPRLASTTRRPAILTRRIAALLAGGALLSLASQSAQAVTYYWDTNGSTTIFGTTASGTWGSSAFWTTLVGGGATHSAVTTTLIGDDVFFGTGTANAGFTSGNVAVTGTVNVRSITFGSATTGNLTLGTAGTTINIGTGSTISVGAGGTTVITIASNLTGTNGFAKTGNVLALSGTNSGLTGAVNVNTGSLIFRNVAAKTGGTMVFAAGTTLGLGVGGAGFFSSTDVDNAFAGTIAGNLTGITVTPTTNVGIDTTAGSFTYATSVGAVSRGLTKFGANTLTLQGANTYTGNTLVHGGILRLENTSAISGSTLVTLSSGTTLQVGTNTPFSGPALSLVTSNIVSDRLSLGAGLTHVFGNVTGISNSAHNFTAGTNGNTATAAIQVGSITNASGSGGSATLNPTTASLIITGGYTGATNAGTNGLILSGSSAANSIAGDITNGTRVTQTLTKSGTSIWSLSGANTYNGGTTISAGVLTFRNLGAKPAAGTHAFGAGTTLGLGVGGAGFFDATDVSNAFAGSMVGNLSNVTVAADTSVGIDTTAGDFTFAAGTGNVTRGLTKLGANTLTLTGLDASAANNHSGATIINEGTLAITTTSPSFTGALTIGALAMTATPGILDLTSASATFAGGLTVNTNSATASEIKIGPGQTLTTNGAVQIGATTPVIKETITALDMTGGGAYVHNGTTFVVGGSTAGAGLSQKAELDLRGLSSATITTSGNFRVAPLTGTNNGSQASLLLPTPVVADTVATTTITSSGAQGISVGNGGAFVAAPQMNTLQLGTGLTKLNAASINIASNPVSGTLRDVGQIIYGQAGGDLIIRAADGTSRASSINLGTVAVAQVTAAFSTSPILFDTSGHDADILVDTVSVGSGHNRTNAQTYQFKFGAGDQVSMASTLDATSVNIGTRFAGNSATTTQTYKMDLSGGTVVLGGTGGIPDPVGTGVSIGNSLYDQAGTATFDSQLNISAGNVTIHDGTGLFAVRLGQSTAANGGTVNSSMNLTGGTTTLTGDIIRGTAVGTVNSTLLISGGALDMSGNDIGTLTSAVTLTAESGTLSNVASINGTGGLTKTTAGTLIVSGTNSYTGTTTVSGGTLKVTGSLSGTTGVAVNMGGTLLLDNDVNNVISSTPGVTLDNGTLAVSSSVSGKSQDFASLTLSSTSTLDFANVASGGNLFSFTGWTHTSGGGILNIANWNGTANTLGTTGTDDRLIFTGTASAFMSNFAQSDISFAGIGAGYSAIQFGGQFEIVPVPEPTTVATAMGLLGLIGWRERRKAQSARRASRK